jgi:ankyrin repeat protein
MSKLLVAANCNLNAQNKRGDTALHYAALYGFHSLFGTLLLLGVPHIRIEAFAIRGRE